jgi:hypothetical protein
MKNLSKDRWSLSEDFNLKHPGCEAGVLATWLGHSVSGH